jgi:hypothetical protein
MSIYTRFFSEDIVAASQAIVTTGLWSGDTGELINNSLFLSDTQINNSGEYYLDVYNTDPEVAPTSASAEVQFAITYGHINGGGAPTLVNNQLATLPTKAIYSQYRNLLLDPTDTKFTFNGEQSDDVYIINVQRSRIREQLDPGNWELPLSGANGTFTFIDDSNQTLGAFTANSKSGRVFKIIEGVLDDVSGSVPDPNPQFTEYGYVYPDLGIMVLSPKAIAITVGFYQTGSSATAAGSTTGSILSGSAPIYTKTNLENFNETPFTGSDIIYPYAPFVIETTDANWGTDLSAYNHLALLASMKLALTDVDYDFRARSAETISSTHYFVRLRNREYNYSNNPTFKDPDNNTIIQPEFRLDPKVYATTVGLYNDRNELLAVAKLSKPVRKSFAEELLLRIRLDF